MGLFDIFKGNKGNGGKTGNNYSNIVSMAFGIFFSSEDVQSELITLAGDSLELAEQLWWFIPTLYFRLLFSEATYVDDNEYTVVYSNGEKKVFLFSENALYHEINAYLAMNSGSFSKEQSMRILSYSAEFDLANKALNTGSKLENMMFCTMFGSYSK